MLGSGISVESGIPTLDSLARYLAQIRSYVGEGAYAPMTSSTLESLLPTEDPAYNSNYSLFLRENGWPPMYELNQELWQWLDYKAGLGSIAERDAMHRRVLKEFQADLEKLQSAVVNELKKNGEESWRSSIRGNWYSLLTELADGDPDYYDSFFRYIASDRKPGNSHRFLAFLSQLMGWRLFLTTNFDDLLEDSLRSENLAPIVFDVAHQAPLPHASLVQSNLSVLKLHGGAYGLRIGESVEYPLDTEAQKRIHEYLPSDPLLIVIGCGGRERRVNQIVEMIARERRRFHDPASGNRNPSVIWVYFGSNPIDRNSRWRELEAEQTMIFVRARDPGSFLSELYYRSASSHPQSNRPYRVHVERPIGLEHSSTDTVSAVAPAPIQLFRTVPMSLVDDRHRYHASEALASFVESHSRDYTIIWIDLESLHTIGAIVTEVLRQCRRFDLTLPPAVLPTHGIQDETVAGSDVGDPSEYMHIRAAALIHEALSRGKYVLALDWVGFYGRPQTTHHGIPRSALSHASDRVFELHKFLGKLLCSEECQANGDKLIRNIRESVICLAINDPTSRYKTEYGAQPLGNSDLQSISALKTKVDSFYNSLSNLPTVCDNKMPDDRTPRDVPNWLPNPSFLTRREIEKEPWLVVRAFLPVAMCVFRRPRSVLAIRSLMREYISDICKKIKSGRLDGVNGVSDKEHSELAIETLGDEDRDLYATIDRLLEELINSGHVVRLDGGFYWLRGDIRDQLYDKCTTYTQTSVLRAFAKPKSSISKRVLAELGDSCDPRMIKPYIFSQLCTFATLHKRIARQHYSQAFLASNDFTSLLEYFYQGAVPLCASFDAANSRVKRLLLDWIHV